jgi:hypothetical protein
MEPLSVLLKLFNDLLDAVGHLAPGRVPVFPEFYGLAVLGEGLQFSQGRLLPDCLCHRPDEDGNDPGLAGGVPFQSPFHFTIITVIRGNEIRTHQQEDDIGPFQVGVDLPPPLLAGGDQAVVPEFDKALTLEN